MENNQPKVKINDINKLTSIKSIFEQKLLDSLSDVTKNDIKDIFSNLFKDSIDKSEKETFFSNIDNIKDENIEKIKKKLRTQYKLSHKFLNRMVEEEKCTKDSEIKIEKEEIQLDLEKKCKENILGMKDLIDKYYETKNKVQDFYEDKTNLFFRNNRYIIIN